MAGNAIELGGIDGERPIASHRVKRRAPPVALIIKMHQLWDSISEDGAMRMQHGHVLSLPDKGGFTSAEKSACT